MNNGTKIEDIYKDYKLTINETSKDVNNENDDKEKKGSKDFRSVLTKRVKDSLSSVTLRTRNDDPETVTEEIDLEYSSKNVPLIRKIFMFLNIHLLTSQFESVIKKIDKYHNDISIFRFPFDLYKEQGWDIEHIDSQTTNPLTATSDQKAWIKGALFDLHPNLTEEQKKKINQDIEMFDERKTVDDSELYKLLDDSIISELKNRNYKNVIRLIEETQETDRNTTDHIGNLTLLDSATNRSYKNALFCTKRREIIKAVSKGRYILPATQYVFMKFFDEDTISTQNRTKWTGSDVRKHHDFILKTLKQFLYHAK